MCGIAGLLCRSLDVPEDALRATALAMADAIAHRGPDDFGAWVDAGAGVALAHRRLSILDLSPLGHQPMLSACGRFVLSFNGEIYNFIELRSELEAHGHSFRGGSDTEVLLAAIVEWGVEKALVRCNGMLAIALWDRHARTLTLARDRVGKKPLYYGFFGDTLLFASELKALFRHPAFRWEIDPDALGLYMQHGWLPHPYAIFRNVRKLPPATQLTLKADADWQSVAPVAYWSSRNAAECGAEAPFTGSLEEATAALDALLLDAVGRRMIADVSLGALLSGGIDSSAVVALMQAQSTRPVKTFCIGFNEAKYNEAGHAAAVADHLGTDHTELYVTAEDSLALIPRLPEMYDEPFADASQIPTFIVSQLARQDVTVALSGDGGDELFAGYAIYPRCLKQWEKWRHWPAGVRRPLAGWLQRAAGLPLLADPDEAHGYARRGRRQKLAGKLAKRAAMMAGDTPVGVLAQKRTYIADARLLVPGALALPWMLTDAGRWARVDEPLLAMQQADIDSYLTDDILVKVDRASMLVALEVRCPLLDYRVIEFALALPQSMRLGAGGGKRVLREVLARYVPRTLTDRPKAGFGLPVPEWLRGPLRDWAESLLDPARIKSGGLLDATTVQRLWRRHLSGSHNHEQVLWSILMFEAWQQRWRQAPSTGSPVASIGSRSAPIAAAPAPSLPQA